MFNLASWFGADDKKANKQSVSQPPNPQSTHLAANPNTDSLTPHTRPSPSTLPTSPTYPNQGIVSPTHPLQQPYTPQQVQDVAKQLSPKTPYQLPPDPVHLQQPSLIYLPKQGPLSSHHSRRDLWQLYYMDDSHVLQYLNGINGAIDLSHDVEHLLLAAKQNVSTDVDDALTQCYPQLLHNDTPSAQLSLTELSTALAKALIAMGGDVGLLTAMGDICRQRAEKINGITKQYNIPSYFGDNAQNTSAAQQALQGGALQQPLLDEVHETVSTHPLCVEKSEKMGNSEKSSKCESSEKITNLNRYTESTTPPGKVSTAPERRNSIYSTPLQTSAQLPTDPPPILSPFDSHGLCTRCHVQQTLSTVYRPNRYTNPANHFCAHTTVFLPSLGDNQSIYDALKRSVTVPRPIVFNPHGSIIISPFSSFLHHNMLLLNEYRHKYGLSVALTNQYHETVQYMRDNTILLTQQGQNMKKINQRVQTIDGHMRIVQEDDLTEEEMNKYSYSEETAIIPLQYPEQSTLSHAVYRSNVKPSKSRQPSLVKNDDTHENVENFLENSSSSTKGDKNERTIDLFSNPAECGYYTHLQLNSLVDTRPLLRQGCFVSLSLLHHHIHTKLRLSEDNLYLYWLVDTSTASVELRKPASSPLPSPVVKEFNYDSPQHLDDFAPSENIDDLDEDSTYHGAHVHIVQMALPTESNTPKIWSYQTSQQIAALPHQDFRLSHTLSAQPASFVQTDTTTYSISTHDTTSSLHTLNNLIRGVPDPCFNANLIADEPPSLDRSPSSLYEQIEHDVETSLQRASSGPDSGPRRKISTHLSPNTSSDNQDTYFPTHVTSKPTTGALNLANPAVHRLYASYYDVRVASVNDVMLYVHTHYPNNQQTQQQQKTDLPPSQQPIDLSVNLALYSHLQQSKTRNIHIGTRIQSYVSSLPPSTRGIPIEAIVGIEEFNTMIDPEHYYTQQLRNYQEHDVDYGACTCKPLTQCNQFDRTYQNQGCDVFNAEIAPIGQESSLSACSTCGGIPQHTLTCAKCRKITSPHNNPATTHFFNAHQHQQHHSAISKQCFCVSSHIYGIKVIYEVPQRIPQCSTPQDYWNHLSRLDNDNRIALEHQCAIHGWDYTELSKNLPFPYLKSYKKQLVMQFVDKNEQISWLYSLFKLKAVFHKDGEHEVEGLKKLIINNMPLYLKSIDFDVISMTKPSKYLAQRPEIYNKQVSRDEVFKKISIQLQTSVVDPLMLINDPQTGLNFKKRFAVNMPGAVPEPTKSSENTVRKELQMQEQGDKTCHIHETDISPRPSSSSSVPHAPIAAVQTVSDHQQQPHNPVVSPGSQQQAMPLRSFTKIYFRLPLMSRIVSPALLQLLLSQIGRKASLAKWHLCYSLLMDGADISLLWRGVKGHNHTLFILKTNQGEVIGGYSGQHWKPEGGYHGNHESFVWRLNTSGNWIDPETDTVKVDPTKLPQNIQNISQAVDFSMLNQGFALVGDSPTPIGTPTNDTILQPSMSSLNPSYSSLQSSMSMFGQGNSMLSQGPIQLTDAQQTYMDETDTLPLHQFSNGIPEIYPWRGPLNYYVFTNRDAFGWGGGHGVSIYIWNNLSQGKSEFSGSFQNPQLTKNKEFRIYELEVWAGR